MDKVFKVMLQSGDVTKVYFVGHLYDVELIVDSLRPGEILHVDVLYLTDFSSENVDSILHD